MKSKGNIQDIYPLTPMQEGMLYHALAQPDSFAYFEQMTFRLRGELNIDIIKKSLARLFKRYDILRTAFVHEGMERPMQIVLKERECGFQYYDISHFENAQAKETFIRDFKTKDRMQHFHLTKDVLMRVSIIKSGENQYEFTWSNHHILMDGWCIGILIADFFEIYNSFLENRPEQLPAVRPYRDYILWLEKQDKKKSKNYWQKYLEDYEQASSIPTLGPLNPLETEQYHVHSIVLELAGEYSVKLDQLLAKYHVTLNTVIQAIWGILLARYAGRQDVVFGSVVSGRPPEIEGIESMVGLFVNSVPIRVTYDEQGNTSFAELLKKIQQNALAGEFFHYFPLAEIQSGSILKQRLLDHLLVFENYPVAEQIDGVAAKEKNKKSGFSFNISASETFEQTNYNFDMVITPKKPVRLKFNFNERVYDISFMERMAGHVYQLVRQVTADPERKINTLVLITEEEKKQLLLEFNNTGEDFPGDKAIQQMVEDQVKKTPGRDAVYYEGECLTYREVNERANRLARHLKDKGIGPERTVALVLERSVDMAVAMLAVLKAGGAFLPIDPGAPPARGRFMLAENQPGILVTQGHLCGQEKELLADFPIANLLRMDDRQLYTGTATNPDIVNRPGDLALVLYTSGTTGKPKGILLEHRNVNNYIHGLNRRIFSLSTHGHEGLLNLGLQAPYTFDGFAQMVLGAMWYGYCAYIVPNEMRADGAAL
ncbi:MAG TPA: condensation domain-containing protein, partial [Candidatus Deferrimicrobium sp.]|nr:condensation domain-containing protein [Candidatus Deferrimicrobium sp.]